MLRSFHRKSDKCETAPISALSLSTSLKHGAAQKILPAPLCTCPTHRRNYAHRRHALTSTRSKESKEVRRGAATASRACAVAMLALPRLTRALPYKPVHPSFPILSSRERS